ncbi:MAG: hypothetical protein JOZ19_13880 [Rubrobacter sp.]|nr:hypothetical protein [Rubrobacter sp.]
MPRGKKKKPIEEKHPMELTTDEAMEHLFGKEVRDKLKEFVQEADRKAEKSPHKRSLQED